MYRENFKLFYPAHKNSVQDEQRLSCPVSAIRYCHEAANMCSGVEDTLNYSFKTKHTNIKVFMALK